ncbi:MAG TPA: hypothetical protein VFB77_18575, partial [Acidimicrobiales bacterium]|nr:hypothetical protein [Acidimicrobiales bacterium]
MISQLLSRITRRSTCFHVERAHTHLVCRRRAPRLAVTPPDAAGGSGDDAFGPQLGDVGVAQAQLGDQ